MKVRELRERFNDYIVARERAELHVSATKSESAENHERPLMSSAEVLVAGVQATGNGNERMRTHPKSDTAARTTGVMSARNMQQ